MTGIFKFKIFVTLCMEFLENTQRDIMLQLATLFIMQLGTQQLGYHFCFIIFFLYRRCIDRHIIHIHFHITQRIEFFGCYGTLQASVAVTLLCSKRLPSVPTVLPKQALKLCVNFQQHTDIHITVGALKAKITPSTQLTNQQLTTAKISLIKQKQH